MPASLISLKLRGVRSYSPYEHKIQTIDFMPLTLIVGANGNGKTTIIESLKFIISGEEPPLSDCRRNFLHTSKDAPSTFDKKTYASIELQFQSAKNDICTARRDISKPAAGKNSTPAISSTYRIGTKPWIDVHKQDDWNKTLPLLFNLPSQAMLDNVILCHQEENLWCMSDSSTVKQIFDMIFGCERYKREIKNIDSEIKVCKNELALGEKDSVILKEKVEYKKRLRSEQSKLMAKTHRISEESKGLDDQIKDQQEIKESLQKEVTLIETKKLSFASLKSQLSTLHNQEAAHRKDLKHDETNLDIEVLRQKEDDHIVLANRSRTELGSSRRRKLDLEKSLRSLESEKADLQEEINNLKVVEMKSKDTHESLCGHLLKIKDEQSITDLNVDDLQASLKTLEKFEQTLLQNKSDQTELEDELARRLQKLTKSISQLEGAYQGLLHKIQNKENFVSKLSDQISQNSPIAGDLLKLKENFKEMSQVLNKISPSDAVDSLRDLIDKSSLIAENLALRCEKEGLTNMSLLEKENRLIEEAKLELENKNKNKDSQSKHLALVEEEHSKVRTASKEAHNKIVVFKSLRRNIIDTYEKYHSEKKLLETKDLRTKAELLEELEKQIASCRAEISTLYHDLIKLEKDYEESFEKSENYKVNVRVRLIMDRISSVHAQIATLESDLSETDHESKLVELRQKLSEVEKKYIELRDKRSMIAGTKAQMAHQLEKIQSELKTYTKISINYAESLGKVVCNKIIISDLEKLKGCFQQSIITFHNEMIIKINEVLRARWRQIYRGSDIDYIELVDEEITRGKDKKSFNYHLAMRKGGLRMRMREKSSAGQKALASIILRMTLAELFVKDFAFIALDEPTANLDLANVQSLAKAIGYYVKRRTRKGINIQWIIITHDENFLKALDAECSPYYYRVQLDEAGCSKISKISYNDVRNDGSADS